MIDSMPGIFTGIDLFNLHKSQQGKNFHLHFKAEENRGPEWLGILPPGAQQ